MTKHTIFINVTIILHIYLSTHKGRSSYYSVLLPRFFFYIFAFIAKDNLQKGQKELPTTGSLPK